MVFDPDNPKEKKIWINSKELPNNVSVKLQVLDVTPQADDDSAFFMNCKIHDGEFKGLTTRLYWWRTKRSSGGARHDFTALCKALLPDKWRNSEPIHSFHFRGKCFEMTPKEFQEGGIRIFVKVKEIELGV